MMGAMTVSNDSVWHCSTWDENFCYQITVSRGIIGLEMALEGYERYNSKLKEGFSVS